MKMSEQEARKVLESAGFNFIENNPDYCGVETIAHAALHTAMQDTEDENVPCYFHNNNVMFTVMNAEYKVSTLQENFHSRCLTFIAALYAGDYYTLQNSFSAYTN